MKCSPIQLMELVIYNQNTEVTTQNTKDGSTMVNSYIMACLYLNSLFCQLKYYAKNVVLKHHEGQKSIVLFKCSRRLV